jgi:Transcriptional Coactivator p15 (PC4)
MDDMTIGTLPKNSRESIAVMLRTFKGHQFCDVRIVVEGRDGEPQPTGKGVAIKPDNLPALIDLLQNAHAEAKKAGWCGNGT